MSPGHSSSRSDRPAQKGCAVRPLTEASRNYTALTAAVAPPARSGMRSVRRAASSRLVSRRPLEGDGDVGAPSSSAIAVATASPATAAIVIAAGQIACPRRTRRGRRGGVRPRMPGGAEGGRAGRGGRRAGTGAAAGRPGRSGSADRARGASAGSTSTRSGEMGSSRWLIRPLGRLNARPAGGRHELRRARARAVYCRLGSGLKSPSRAATATAWVRLLTPIFPRIRWMCVPTVFGLR